MKINNAILQELLLLPLRPHVASCVMRHLLRTRLVLSRFIFQNYFAINEWNWKVRSLWLLTDLKSSLRFLIYVIGVVALYFAKDDWIDKWSNLDSRINSDHPICSWMCSSIQVHSCSNWSWLNPCWLWRTCESIWIFYKLIRLVVRTFITFSQLIWILFGISNNP